MLVLMAVLAMSQDDPETAAGRSNDLRETCAHGTALLIDTENKGQSNYTQAC
jgi:hypothetical protein